jgi:hypothetical protein
MRSSALPSGLICPLTPDLSKVVRFRRERVPKESESVAQVLAVRHFLASSFPVPLTCGLGDAALPSDL